MLSRKVLSKLLHLLLEKDLDALLLCRDARLDLAVYALSSSDKHADASSTKPAIDRRESILCSTEEVVSSSV